MAICQGDNAVANEVISQTFEAAERDTSEEVSVKKVNNTLPKFNIAPEKLPSQ